MANHADLTFWVVKTHNRINTQRALLHNVGNFGSVVDGPQERRANIYIAAMEAVREFQAGASDHELREVPGGQGHLKLMVAGPRYDHLGRDATNSGNRDTRLYRAAARFCTRQGARTHYPRAGYERPAELRQIMLQCHTLENSPEDWFNCVRIIDPSIYGSVQSFHKRTCVAGTCGIGQLSGTGLLHGREGCFITHQVDKTDPDIASSSREA